MSQNYTYFASIHPCRPRCPSKLILFVCDWPITPETFSVHVSVQMSCCCICLNLFLLQYVPWSAEFKFPDHHPSAHSSVLFSSGPHLSSQTHLWLSFHYTLSFLIFPSLITECQALSYYFSTSMSSKSDKLLNFYSPPWNLCLFLWPRIFTPYCGPLLPSPDVPIHLEHSWHLALNISKKAGYFSTEFQNCRQKMRCCCLSLHWVPFEHWSSNTARSWELAAK